MKPSILIVISLFVCSCVYSQQNNFEEERPANLFPTAEIVTRYHNEWTVKNYRKRIDVFKNDIPTSGCIFFIGNSITQQGGDWSDRFGGSNVKNRGIAGDVTDGVLKRLDEIVYYKPKAIFILIGINDLFNIHYKEDTKGMKYDKIIPSAHYVGKNITKIAKTLHNRLPNTKIYVRTVMPTRRDFLKEDILKVNKVINKESKKGYFALIDFYSEFVDDLGYLAKGLTNDGVHLNEAGYKKWVDIEKETVNEFYH